jgi:hypothetical protein
VAPTALNQFTINPVAVTFVTDRLSGGPGDVTIYTVEEGVLPPPASIAITVTAYVVPASNPVNVADFPVTVTAIGLIENLKGVSIENLEGENIKGGVGRIVTPFTMNS